VQQPRSQPSFYFALFIAFLSLPLSLLDCSFHRLLVSGTVIRTVYRNSRDIRTVLSETRQQRSGTEIHENRDEFSLNTGHPLQRCFDPTSKTKSHLFLCIDTVTDTSCYLFKYVVPVRNYSVNFYNSIQSLYNEDKSPVNYVCGMLRQTKHHWGLIQSTKTAYYFGPCHAFPYDKVCLSAVIGWIQPGAFAAPGD
jgi:hypothetical protein